jgi:hypothetical protein
MLSQLGTRHRLSRHAGGKCWHQTGRSGKLLRQRVELFTERFATKRAEDCWPFSIMADIVYIPPNFGIKKFQTEAELRDFLKRFCFELIIRRRTRDVWETSRQPKRRAIAYKSKSGSYVAAQINGRREKPPRRFLMRHVLCHGEVLPYLARQTEDDGGGSSSSSTPV